MPFDLIENADLTTFSTLRTPSRARYFCELKSIEDLFA